MADDRDEMSTPEVVNNRTVNKFANDGSFLEMFKKKMQEQTSNTVKKCKTDSDKDETKEETTSDESSEKIKMDKTNVSLLVGKRRSGGAAKSLKTGIVKKSKQEEDMPAESKDGWSKYMAEVNKYKSRICTEEDKTRPLVK